MGHLKNWGGEYTEALRHLSEGVRLASEQNLPVQLLQCLWVKGLALVGGGDYDEARLALEESLTFSEKVGDEIWGLRILNSLGWLYSECGDLERALDHNRKAVAGARKRGDPETIANSELNLGDILLTQGDLGLAEELFDGVYSLVRNPATSEFMRWRYSIHLFASMARLWLTREDLAKAHKFVEQCLEIARDTNSLKYLVMGWRLKGEIALLNKQWSEGEGWLKQALSLAQTVGNPTQLWKTHLALGRLQDEAKRPEMAHKAYRAAREVIDRVKKNLQDPGLRASFDRSPLIRQIYELSKFD
jgi:tetratricopeptide (TPR) repeat protein